MAGAFLAGLPSEALRAGDFLAEAFFAGAFVADSGSAGAWSSAVSDSLSSSAAAAAALFTTSAVSAAAALVALAAPAAAAEVTSAASLIAAPALAAAALTASATTGGTAGEECAASDAVRAALSARPAAVVAAPETPAAERPAKLDMESAQASARSATGQICSGTEPGIFYDDGGDGDIFGRTEHLFDNTLGDRVGVLIAAPRGHSRSGAGDRGSDEEYPAHRTSKGGLPRP